MLQSSSAFLKHALASIYPNHSSIPLHRSRPDVDTRCTSHFIAKGTSPQHDISDTLPILRVQGFSHVARDLFPPLSRRGFRFESPCLYLSLQIFFAPPQRPEHSPDQYPRNCCSPQRRPGQSVCIAVSHELRDVAEQCKNAGSTYTQPRTAFPSPDRPPPPARRRGPGLCSPPRLLPRLLLSAQALLHPSPLPSGRREGPCSFLSCCTGTSRAPSSESGVHSRQEILRRRFESPGRDQ